MAAEVAAAIDTKEGRPDGEARGSFWAGSFRVAAEAPEGGATDAFDVTAQAHRGGKPPAAAFTDLSCAPQHLLLDGGGTATWLPPDGGMFAIRIPGK